MYSINKELFGYTKNNEPVSRFTLSDDFITVKVLDLGCAVQSICLKDKNGNIKDVVLGYDNVENYEKQDVFLGVVVGRCANRVANAEFTLDGTTYSLPKNDGNNSLHGGGVIDKSIWNSEIKDNSVVFTLVSEDGAQGYPSNLTMQVTYTLENQGLVIDYKATTDGATLCNLTNHSYFNLDGHESGCVCKQKVKINADYYTPIDAHSIPLGENEKVDNTPFDLREFTEIGTHWDDDNEQIKNGSGDDHNFVLNGKMGELRTIANVKAANSGINMEVLSTMAGVQLYTGNFLCSALAGKNNADYPKRSGLCLETQYYPDAIHHENWYQPVVRKGETWSHKTVYRFSVE